MKAKSSRRLSVALLGLAFFSLSPQIRAASDTDMLDIAVGSPFTVNNGGSNTRHLAFLSYVNSTAVVSFSQHPDAVIFPTTDGLVTSADGGATWPNYVQNANFYLSSVIGVTGGDMMGTSYITQQKDSTDITDYYWLSADNGVTWAAHTGNVALSQAQLNRADNWGGFLFHRSLIQMTDGSIQGTMYGAYATDTKSRVLWVKSTDAGANWTVIATVAYSTTISGTEGFGEPVAIQAADGSLLVVMRTGSSLPLYQTRSTNGGVTWSTPVELPGVPASSTYSVDPDLIRMANGTLVLSFGRPSTNLLFSLDGSGYNWSYLTTPIFASSGSCYMGVREVATNQLLVITDNTALTEIVGEYVRVVRTALDDFEGLALGSVPVGYTVVGANGQVVNNEAYAGTQSLRIWDSSNTILTNVVKSSVAATRKTLDVRVFPVAAPNGDMIDLASGGNDNTHSVFHCAIFSDGSFSYYNGSAWTILGAAGTITFNAWNEVKIDALSTTAANVYLNGVLKGTATNWNTFSTIDRVRFLSGSTSGTGDDFYVDNVHFWSQVDDFETDTIAGTPAGYTVVGAGGTTSATKAFSGSKSLYISDTSSSVLTNVVATSTAAASKYFEARVYPVAAPNGDIIDLASGGNDNTHSVFHFAIFSDGSFNYYNGSAWTALGGAGTITFNAWNDIRIDAVSTTAAHVYVNGVLKGTASNWNAFSTIDRLRFMSGSTTGTGDNYYVDDVYFY